MDNQSSRFNAANRSHHDVNASVPQYVEATVFVTTEFPERGFAFGAAKINGQHVEVFIGKNGCAKKVNGQWQKLPPQEQRAPYSQDELRARIRLSNEPGKKPSAILWEVLPDLDAWQYADDEIGC